MLYGKRHCDSIKNIIFMGNEIKIYDISQIENQIFTVRGVHFMLDSHLAEMYGVEIRVINQAVKRNINRFPDKFMFQITEAEWDFLRSHFVTLKTSENILQKFDTLKENRGKHRKYLPYAFTEQGVAMLSAVLRSETAIQVSVQIMNTFVEMRKNLGRNIGLLQRLENVEQKLTTHNIHFERIFKALESGNVSPKQDIFFNGQIYDAFSFVIKLIEKAKKNILIIDNYVDSIVFDMLAKKAENVAVHIITQANTPIKALDISKFNQQYPTLSLNHNANFHDRFLLIDGNELYHIGASLKDLGKKCFAFSKIEDNLLIDNLINKI
jgi:phage regulator Rha-like protein